MTKQILNDALVQFETSYLFATIGQKKKECSLPLIDLGIGDSTDPIAKAITEKISQTAKELTANNPGYGPTTGYSFLKQAIQKRYYASLPIEEDEIFISDGAKTDSSHITNLFSQEMTFGFCDPVYPVYLSSNSIMGKTKSITIPLTEENGFLPQPPEEKCDLVYLCSPNNPTGVAWDRSCLEKFVHYALENNAVLIMDGAYVDFITDETKVRSIYEIEGARKVAIEMRSFSKTAGFTGLRVGYTVIPKELIVENQSLHTLWNRYLSITSNGTSYVMQKAAEAALSDEGFKEITATIHDIQKRASFFKGQLEELGYTVYGGTDCPYLWVKVPQGYTSWEFFDELLNTHGIVSTPGQGFGNWGEGFIRFSCFAQQENITKAINKLKQYAATH